MRSKRGRVLFGLAALLALSWLAYREASREQPTTPPEIPAGLDEAVVEALAEARQRVLDDPRSGWAWGELGFVFMAHNLNPEARRCFQQAGAIQPDNPAWPHLIGIGLKEDRPDEAQEYLERAYSLARAPEEISATRLALAEHLLDHRRAEEAHALLLDELKHDPRSVRARYVLGSIALQRNDPAGAVEFLKGVASLPQMRPRVAAILAIAYQQLGQPERAARHASESNNSLGQLHWPDPFLDKMTARGVGRTNLVNRASQLHATGRAEEALQLLEELCARYPDHQTLGVLAEARMGNRQWDQAEQALRRSLEYSPQRVETFHQLGIVRFEMGEEVRLRDPALARKHDLQSKQELLQAIERKPGYAAAHLALARVQQRLGDLAEAKGSCRQAIRNNPSDSASHLLLGEILLEQMQPAEAVPHLQEAARLAADPEAARTLLERAKARIAKPK